MDLQEVVELSGDVVAFGHLGDVLDDIYEGMCYITAHLFQFYGTEHLKAEIQFLGIQDGYIFLDEAVPFESFETFEDRGCGQVDFCSKLLGGQTRIFLQKTKQLDVGCVQVNLIHGIFFCLADFFNTCSLE